MIDESPEDQAYGSAIVAVTTIASEAGMTDDRILGWVRAALAEVKIHG